VNRRDPARPARTSFLTPRGAKGVRAPGGGVLEELRANGVARGDSVGLTVAPEIGAALATPARTVRVPAGGADLALVVQRVDDALRPRWVMWSNATARPLVEAGVRVATSWDIAAVQRLLFGGWRADPARVWAQLHDLALDALPSTAPPDLFSDLGDQGADDDRSGDPIRSDGYLRSDWAGGGWSATPERLGRWAELALAAAERQRRRLAALHDRPRALATARAESAAELVCAELSVDGLPIDRAVAQARIGALVGPRPRSEAEAAEQRARRDAEVLRHAPADAGFDLRSPGQVKSLLHRIGVDLPDTRAWRLEPLRDTHPLIGALLAWRKAERVATTYGYAWLDEHVHDDGRLRGVWSGSDGAAGRMTASAGLHNMPSDMRDAVVAEAGRVFVRADLGQIEPRVLAAVSGDRELARATIEADMYAPVAQQLGVDRETAKVAMLGAMYGQTTGHGARARRGLESTFPVAMAYLQEADRAGQQGHALRTYGGRLIPMANEADSTNAQSAARGRYGRNAMVQGAAAELFKVWAVTVRARVAPLDARIVLCLHDELLVHAPIEHGEAVARLLEECLQEAACRWAPDDSVRFVADASVISRWSEAKG
jgi:DNA polymerase I